MIITVKTKQDIPDTIKLVAETLYKNINSCHKGINIVLKKQTGTRTIEQNKLLWAIYNHIIAFFADTGFIIDRLPLYFLTPDFLHEYFKIRFNVASTANLSIDQFTNFINGIETEMTRQSHGAYTPYTTDFEIPRRLKLSIEIDKDNRTKPNNKGGINVKTF